MSRTWKCVAVAALVGHSQDAVAAEAWRGDVGVQGGVLLHGVRRQPAFGLAAALAPADLIAFTAGVVLLPDTRGGRNGFLPRPGPQERGLPSVLTVAADVGALLSPITLDMGTTLVTVHVGTGVGVVRTQDDLDSWQMVSDPDAIAAQNQWHPTAVVRTGLQARPSAHTVVRADVSVLLYVENVSWMRDLQSPALVTLSLGWAL